MAKLIIFGDICPTEDTMERYLSNSSHLFSSEIKSAVEKADFVIGNLECALTDHPTPIKKAGPVLFAPMKVAETLKRWGIHALSMANNHIRDCGDEGVKSSIEACRQQGIDCFGAGENEQEAKRPLIIEINGKQIGIYAMAEREFNHVEKGRWGANAFDVYSSFEEIQEIRKNVDYLIVLYHGGIEYYAYPSPLLQKKCRKMVDYGADFVLCQHSHCIGCIEHYKNGEILYGQGNSLYGFRKNNDIWNHGLMVELMVADHINVSYHVMKTTSSGDVYLTDNTKIYNEMLFRSKKLNDKDFLSNEWKTFCQKQETLYLPLLFGTTTNVNRLNRLLHNKWIDWFYTRQQKNVTNNLIRCDAHREVVETLLDKYNFE